MIGFVDLHENAKIWAESEGEGKGCTFFVRVPVHSHSTLGILASGIPAIFASRPIISTLTDTQVDLTLESCQLAVAATKVMPEVSENDSKQSFQLSTASAIPVIVEVWKPSVLVVDDSSMNRKVKSIIHLSHTLPNNPV